MKTRHNLGRALPTAAILLAAFAAGLGLYLGGLWYAPQQPALQAGLLYPVPREIPEFTLAGADGRALHLADWKGRWTLVFFGYASCPDVCPTTLATLKQAMATVKSDGAGDRVRVDFISVDPQRDKPEALKRYVEFFSPDFVAASGSDEELTRLGRALGLVFARTPLADGTYSVDHSASVVIVDPQGHVAGMFRPPYEAAKIAADLLTLSGKH